METTIKTSNLQSSRTVNSKDESSFFATLFNDAEKNRFGIIPILIIVIACIGGFTAAFGAGDSAFELGLVIFPTVIALALTLAVAPMRLILWVSTLSILIDLIVFIL
ncbi:MAG TPA: hypothetical protein PLL00_11170 [Bacteroidia bacterium]|nr:hypothetical protein [Bacteroidia bacterium]